MPEPADWLSHVPSLTPSELASVMAASDDWTPNLAAIIPGVAAITFFDLTRIPPRVPRPTSTSVAT